MIGEMIILLMVLVILVLLSMGDVADKETSRRLDDVDQELRRHEGRRP